MPIRKFYVGDIVEVARTSRYAVKHSYGADLGQHRGVINQTTRARRNTGWNSVLNYTVECECGQEIHPIANDLNLISEPSGPEYVPINHDARLRHFLLTIDVVEDSTIPLLEQARTILRPLKPRERYVIAMRFGIAGVLSDSPFESGKLCSEYPLSRTLSDIGEELGVTRERIRQIELEGLRRAKGDKNFFHVSAIRPVIADSKQGVKDGIHI